VSLRDRIGLVVGALAALGVVPLFLSGTHTRELATAGAYTVAILGLDLLVGACGRLSFGQGAFMALGGYTTAILAARHGVRDIWTIPAAGGLAGAAGLVLGLPSLRARGRMFEVATFGAAIAIPTVALRFEALTGGAGGTMIGGHRPWVAYLVSWGVAAALFLVAWWTAVSRLALRLRAARDNELAASAAGLSRHLDRLGAFTIAGAYGGVAGSLLVIDVGHADPGTFPLRLSLLLLGGALLAGLGSIWGAVLAAVLIRYLDDLAGLLPHIGARRTGPASFVLGSLLVAFALARALAAAARARHAPAHDERAEGS
jgi:branched-chain amino acid transport system permease protein